MYQAKTLVCFSKNEFFDKSIKEIFNEKMYYSKEVLKKTNEGKNILMYLFEYINKKPKKL